MRLILSLAIVFWVTACTTTDPYTGEREVNKTTAGAAIGAVAGAIAGAATSSDKDRDRGIITGAVAGAAIGGGVGVYMDKQEAKLRQRLEGSGVRVVRDGNSLKLVMPGNVTFDTASSNIRSNFFPVLDSVVEVLNEFNKTSIKISGHTDSVGNAEYNQTLSEQRANSVENYLVNRKVASGRVHAVGFGERQPIASNATVAGKQANRRVELELQPLE